MISGTSPDSSGKMPSRTLADRVDEVRFPNSEDPEFTVAKITINEKRDVVKIGLPSRAPRKRPAALSLQPNSVFGRPTHKLQSVTIRVNRSEHAQSTMLLKKCSESFNLAELKPVAAHANICCFVGSLDNIYRTATGRSRTLGATQVAQS